MSNTFELASAGTLRTVEEVERARKAFEAFVASIPDPGDFRRELRTYIGVIDLLPECDPRSMGMLWIEHNVDSFVTLVLSGAYSVEDFLRSCFWSPFITNVLYMPQLLRYIDKRQRKAFIEDLLQQQSPPGFDWDGNVYEVCPEFDFGAYLLDAVRAMHSDSPYFEDIVRGHGPTQFRSSSEPNTSSWTLTHREGTIWGALSDTQFVELVGTLTDKKPELLFGPDSDKKPSFRQTVEARLMQPGLSAETRANGARTVQSLIDTAGSKLTNLQEVRYDGFKRLSGKQQIELLRKVRDPEVRMSCSILLIAEMALDRGSNMIFIANAWSILQDTEGNSTAGLDEYMALRKILLPYKDSSDMRMCNMARSIELTYRAALERNGFVFGVVTQGVYFDQRIGRKVRQHRVNVRDGQHLHRYVHNIRPGYQPQVDDLVLFHKDGPKLVDNPTYKVVCVSFTLIERPQRLTTKPGSRR